MFLRNVDAGTIRIVTWWGGKTHIYRGPGKSFEMPLLTNGTTLSSKAINVDLDITDQTADIDERGTPQPIKVRVLASAIVSVGDTDTLTRPPPTASSPNPRTSSLNTITDLLSSSGRRAVNLLTHDQLFSAKTAPRPGTAIAMSVAALPAPAATLATIDNAPALVDRQLAAQVAEDDDDPLAIIIRKACSRELTDLGLIFNSLNIKVVQSEVAEARRRMSAAEATANAEIVAAQQACRSQQAKTRRRAQHFRQHTANSNKPAPPTPRSSPRPKSRSCKPRKSPKPSAARPSRRPRRARTSSAPSRSAARRKRSSKPSATISDRQRELEQTILANAALIAEAEAKKQDALAVQREAELRATQIAQATADAERVRIDAQASAQAEAIRITTVAQANAESIRKVNEAIQAGGESYLRYRQVEMLPQMVPAIADALAQAKLVTICSGNESEGAAGATTDNISGVIRTVLAAQLVARNDAGIGTQRAQRRPQVNRPPLLPFPQTRLDSGGPVVSSVVNPLRFRIGAINVGVVGVGHIGKSHARVYAALADSGRATRGGVRREPRGRAGSRRAVRRARGGFAGGFRRRAWMPPRSPRRRRPISRSAGFCWSAASICSWKNRSPTTPRRRRSFPCSRSRRGACCRWGTSSVSTRRSARWKNC